MSTRSRKRASGEMLLPEYEDYVETRFLAAPRKPDSDASFLTGLILGALAGAGLFLATTPLVRDQVQQLAQQLGLTAPGTAGPTATALRDEVLTRVAPPPDPLSSSDVPPPATI